MQSRASHATTAYEKIFCRKDMLKLLIGRAKAMVHLWVCLYPMQLVAIRCLVGEGGGRRGIGGIYWHRRTGYSFVTFTLGTRVK